ncbi:putative reverse transcriptase domain-containing protein [Tanacetum coccineum]
MTRSSTKELITPFENPKRVFRSKKRLFETPGLVESSSPEFDLFSDFEEHSEEEKTTEIMTETMEQYMSKTHGNYGSGVARTKINDKTHFELEGKFLKEFGKNTFSGSELEDANEHIEKVPEIVYLFHIPRQILDSKGAIPTKTVADAKVAIQEMAESDANYAKDHTTQRTVHSRKKGKLLRRLTTHSFGAPYQPGGQYRVAGLGFYQRNNRNSSYLDRRQTLEESLTKFMANLTRKRNQKSAQLNRTKLKGPFKSNSTAKADSSVIRRIGSGPKPYQRHSIVAYLLKQFRFLIDCMVTAVMIGKRHALVDLGASVNVMPVSTYSNLGLGDLAHTRLTIELADRTIKHPRGIAENVLVRIGKFIFPIDFVILDIPKDDDVPLILGRLFLSTAHAKIDVFKTKITLRVGEEKLVFKSIKPATSIVKRVYMVKERTDLGSKTEFVGESINESFNPLYGFSSTGDIDITSGIVLGMPFCKNFVSCQNITERFAHGDKCKRMDEEGRK